MLDVVVVGAGLAGLMAAQQLQQRGYAVRVLEKSRGVGGRVATRRIGDIAADHGLRHLEPQGEQTQHLIHTLTQTGQLLPWTSPIEQIDPGGARQPRSPSLPRYTAPAGINILGKALAQGLTIQRQHRVEAIAPQPDQSWRLTLAAIGEEHPGPVLARALVLAIPAPQILPLVTPLTAHGLEAERITALQGVDYDPCITAIATYPPLAPGADREPWGTLAWPTDSPLAWLTQEQTKRAAPGPVLVAQSSAAFAAEHLEEPDLPALGQRLLAIAAAPLAPWIAQPDILQVHRWRYAIPRRPLGCQVLTSAAFPSLVCGGDWCSTGTVEGALQSGQAIADWIHSRDRRSSASIHLAQDGGTP